MENVPFLYNFPFSKSRIPLSEILYPRTHEVPAQSFFELFLTCICLYGLEKSEPSKPTGINIKVKLLRLKLYMYIRCSAYIYHYSERRLFERNYICICIIVPAFPPPSNKSITPCQDKNLINYIVTCEGQRRRSSFMGTPQISLFYLYSLWGCFDR